MDPLASAPGAEQLELPLASEPQCLPAPALATGDKPTVDDEPPADWSLEQELVLHGVMLERNLKLLSSGNNVEEKRDVLRWIFRPDVTHFTVRERRLTQHQDDVAFSFRRCCRLAGYDADELRDALRVLLKRRGIEVPDHERPAPANTGVEPS